MTPNAFKNEVMDTQTGGTPLPEPQPLPQNIKPVQQAVTPSVEVNKTVNIQEPVATAQPEQQSPKLPNVNRQFTEELYKYAQDYTKEVLKKDYPLSYEEYVAKNFSDPQTAGAYYDKLVASSKYKPLPISFKNGYKSYKEMLNEANPADFSDFVRTPFMDEGISQSVQKAGAIPQKEVDVTIPAQQFATAKIDDVKKKYGLMQQGAEAVTSGMQGSSEEMLPKEKSIFEKMEESKPDDNRYAEYLKQKEEDITLQNWNPEGYGRLPKADLPVFSMTNLKNAPEEVEKYNFDVALATKYNENDLKSFGNNPFYALDKSTAIEQGKPVFAWDKDITNSSTNTEYWEKVGENFEYIPLLSVDAYGRRDESLKKLPASMQMPFDHLWKYESTINPQSTKVWGEIVDIEKTKKLKGGKYPEETFKPVSILKEIAIDYFNFDSKESQGKQLIDIAKKKNVIADQKYVLDIENAFELQRRSVIGEYRKGIVTKDQAEKALSGLEKTYNKIYDINPEIKGIRDKMRSDYNKAVAEQKQADITEKRRRIKYPILAELWYGSGARGGWEGAKEVMRDYAGLVDFVTQTNSTFTSDIRKTFGEAVTPSSLQGDIFEDGKFHPSRLLDRSANVVSQMGGLIIGSKGFGTFGKMAKNLTGVAKLESYLPQYLSSFNMMYDDNHDYAKSELTKQGISGDAAEIMSDDYAIRVTNAVSLVEGMFDIPFTKGLSKIKDDFSALIKAGDSGFMATTKAIGSGMKNFTTEGLKEGGEEFAQELLTKAENARFNVNSGISSLDENLDKKEILELLTVTGASVLAMGAGTGRLIDTPLTKKVAIWNAVQDPANFSKQLDTWVEKGRITKEQATVMKQGVDEVKSVITGLPSAKELTDKQKLDLGLLIYEKKKLDEEVKGGYVDEIFAEEKNKEIEAKKKKLNDKIVEVYNQNNDRNKVLAEAEKMQKEKQEAQLEASRELANVRLRVFRNAEEVESDEEVINKTFQPTDEKTAMPDTREQFKIEDGHHRYMAYKEKGIEEVEVQTPDGEIKTVGIEQLKPTEPLKEKKRKTINSLKKAIDEGETIEPIKVEAVTPTQEAEALSDLTLYHGGHKNIEEEGFNDSKLGTGYGNMMSGAGHYLTDSKDEAKGYMSQAASKQENINDLIEKQLNNNEDRVKYKKYKIAYEKYNKIKQALEAGKNIDVNKSKGIVDRLLKILTDIKNYYYNKKSHTLFSSLLDMELQVLSTKESIAEKIRGTKEVALNIEPYSVKIKNGDLLDLLKPVTEKLKNEIKKDYPDLPDDIFKNGHMLYEWLSRKYNSDIKASKYLSSKGIIGNKFRSAGSNHYIIYSGSNISVLNKPYTGIKQAKTETGKETDVLTEPKVEQIKTEQDAKEVRSAQKRPNEQGQVGKASAKKTKASRNVQTPKESPKVEVPKVEPVVTEAEKEPEIIRTARDEERKVVDEIEPKQTSLRSEVKNSSNETVKKGLSAIDKGLDQANDLTEVKVDGKGFREWVRNAKDSGRITQEEFDNLNKKFDQHKKDFGKKKTAYERVRKAVERAAGLKFIGTDRAGMNIFTIPLNMPIAIIKGTAKVMLKAMDAAATMDYNTVGKATVDHMRKSKWFQNLSPKEKSAINKFIKENGEFEAMTMIIDEGARDYKTTGEKIAKDVAKTIKAEDKKTAEKIATIKPQRKQAKAEATKETKSKIRQQNKEKKSIEKLKERANGLRRQLSKRMRGEIGDNDKKMIGLLRTLDPNKLFQAGGKKFVEKYNALVEKLLHDTSKIKFEKGTTKVKSPEREVSQATVNEFMKEAEKVMDDYAFEKFKQENEFRIKSFQKYGFLSENPSRQEIETVFEKYNIETRQMDDMIDEQYSKDDPDAANKLVEIREAVKDDIDRLKKEKFDDMPPAEKKVVDNIASLEVDKLTPSQLVKAHYTINNIIANGKDGLAGAGQVEAIAIAQKASNELEKVFKKYKVEGLREFRGSLLSNEFMTLPAVRNAIAVNQDLAADIGKVLKQAELGAGYSEMMEQLKLNWTNKKNALKRKYGKGITKNAENRIRQGMYSLGLQWQGDQKSTDDRDAWFEDNKELLKEDIAIKEASSDKNIQEEARIMQNIYDKIFEKSKTMEDLEAAMDAYAGDKAMVKLAQDVYNANLEKFQRSSIIYANESLDLWNNYTHRKWKEMESGKWIEFKDVLKGNTNPGLTVWDKNVNRSSAVSAKTRSDVRPKKNRVLNLDFFSVQDKAIHDAYYQANTLGTRFAIKEVFDNPEITKMLGEKNAKILRDRTLDAINHQMGVTQLQAEMSKGAKKLLNFIIRTKATGALGGPGAYLKQSVGGLVGAMFRNPENGYKAFKYIGYNPNTNLFSKSNLRSRYSAVFEGNIEDVKNLGDPLFKKGFNKFLNSIDDLSKKTSEGENLIGKVVGLKPLQVADYHTAKAAWMTYYETKWKQENPGSAFSWDEQSKNPDETASAYADHMVETTMNVNDVSNAGDYFRSQDGLKKAFRSMLNPFSSFSINQDYRMINAFRNLHSLNNGSKAQGMLEMLSIAGEQIAFNYTKAALKVALLYASASVIGLTGGDDEDEEKKADKIYDEYFGKKAGIGFLKVQANAIMDALPLGGVFPPLSSAVESLSKELINNSVKNSKYAKKLFGEDMGQLFPKKGYNMYGNDTNFDLPTEAAIYLDAFGILGESIHDIITTGQRGYVGLFGYKDKNGNYRELTQSQKMRLWGLVVKDLVGVGTGFTFQEFNRIVDDVRFDLEKEIRKGKRSGYSGVKSGSVSSGGGVTTGTVR